MMNVLKVITLMIACISLTVLAGNGNQSTNSVDQTLSKQTATQDNTEQATTARKPKRATSPSQKAPDKISAAPGTVLTLCCGLLDPHSMAGENCAYMHSGQGCGGFILACPEGTKETVKKDGSGYCKED